MHAAVADEAGDEAEDESCARLHETGGRGDHDEAGDDAGTEAEGGGLAGVDPFGDHPGKAGRRRGDGGGGEGQAGQAAGCVGAVDSDDGGTGVETEPAEPEHTDAEHGQRQTMGRHPLLREAVALAEENEGCQCRNTGREMNDGAAGEVERTLLEEPAIGHPDPVGQRVVDQRGPEEDEEAIRRELDPLGKGTGDECYGNNGEHRLVHGENILGDGPRFGRDVLEEGDRPGCRP